MAPGLTQIVLLESVTHFLFHKTQAVSNTLRCIFSVVRDKQQLRAAFANQYIDKATHQLAINRIQPLQRLIQNQQFRL